MKFKIIITLAIIAFTKVAFSQNSSIKGKVIDEKTGETLPGATVILEGTTIGGNTDLDGNFTIANVAPGTYKLVCKLISYNTKIIEGVTVKSGDPTFLSISMGTASTDLGVVEVTATMGRETTSAMLIMQKNSATVSDGVSSESIKRTPDKSTSDVLKRVSGASIQDNKFAIIRGLNDRYNAAYINGAPLPSSESDRKAFSFDIFPSNMLDNLMIIKTATPDLPGEFAGGIIQINTKNIPDKNFQMLSVGAGYNTITTGKEQITYNGGKRDWLGTDDGSRAMPSNIPAQEDFPVNIDEQARIAQETNVDWSTHKQKFSPNYNFQYSMGYTVPLGSKPLGILFALTYNKTNNYNETIKRNYSGNAIGSTTPSQIENDYLDKTYSEQILAGALANISFKINDNHSLSFKNLYSINSDDKVIAKTGKVNALDINPTLLKATALWFTSNKIYSGQLIGEHYLPKAKIRINWVGSLSDVEREIPNLRRNIYTRNQDFNDPSDPWLLDTVYCANISNSNVGADYGGGMFFSKNRERIYSFGADASYTVKLGKEFKTEVKIGGFYQSRQRDFFARQLGYTKYAKIGGGGVYFNDSLLYLNESEIFLPANMGLTAPGVGGFKLVDGTKPADAYSASSTLTAGYIMLDHKYKMARLVWGARLENFRQQLNANKTRTEELQIDSTLLDILPSANLILSVTEKQNVRLSYSQTLNRPEYRELAPFVFHDFSSGFDITGNDTLQRAKIHNADVRYEFYPGRGQLVSVSGFYKQFINPIEQISQTGQSNSITYTNAPKAINYGLELEFRILLASICHTDSVKILNNLTAFSNLAIIRSAVETDTINSGASSRSLQGQSPYVLNAGIQYIDPDLGMSVSLSYNKVGPRIYIVGNVDEPNLWENSRSFLDLQLTKSFWKKRIELKVNFSNILAQEQVYYQNRDLEEQSTSGTKGFFNSVLTGERKNENAYNRNEDDLIFATKFGRTYSASISFKF